MSTSTSIARGTVIADARSKILSIAVLALDALALPAAARADLYYVIFGGLGGEPKYQEAFDKEVQQLAAVARRTTGDSRVAVLSGEHATKAAVEKLLGAERAKVKASDTFALILVGH